MKLVLLLLNVSVEPANFEVKINLLMSSVLGQEQLFFFLFWNRLKLATAVLYILKEVAEVDYFILCEHAPNVFNEVRPGRHI